MLAPFARRDAEPLLEDAAEMGEVVKAPCEGDLADVPGMVGGVGEIALAALQPLRLHVARGTRSVRRPSDRWRSAARFRQRRSARQRQFGIEEMRQDMIPEAIEQRRPVSRLVRQARVQPVGQRHREQVERLVEQAACGRGIDLLDRPAHIAREIIGQSFERTIAGKGCRLSHRTSRRAVAAACAASGDGS